MVRPGAWGRAACPRQSFGAPAARIGYVRLLIGLIQGASLYALTKAFDATGGALWAGGAFAAVLLSPAILLAETPKLLSRWLLLWFAGSATIVGLLGAWAIWREQAAYAHDVLSRLGLFIPCAAALLFSAHHLVAAGAEARRWIAPYAAYFDTAWRHGLQAVLSGMFLGIFWLVLWLGALLFHLIGQEFLRDLMKHDWFWIPVSAAVFAGAVHLTDVRINLVRGFRTMILTLFSVLLPLVAALSAVFLVLGAATGMRGVWTAQSAAATLLSVCVAMIVFINAAYQDGAEERSPGLILRWTMRASPFLALPLVALSANTIVVLVLRHGWTPERVVAAAGTVIVLAHMGGYAVAAVSKGPFMRRVESTNVISAHLALIIGLLLLSPIGDPARISVDSQMRALLSGRTPPAKFDFRFLASRSARFGADALVKLRASGDPAIAQKARNAGLPWTAAPQLTQADRLTNIKVYPAGAVLPAGVLDVANPKQRNFLLPTCLYAEADCIAYVIDLNKDGHTDVLFAQYNQLTALVWGPSGWALWAAGANSRCANAEDGLKAGQVVLAPPTIDDVLIGEGRYRLAPTEVCQRIIETRRQP